jgi:protein-disulfide isomerase
VKRFEALVTAIMAIAAVAVAGALVHRELRASNGGASATSSQESRRIADQWERILDVGRPLAGTGGRPVIAVFSDYECPACRQFHALVSEIDSLSPGSLDVRYLHLPLVYHRLALPAARLAECAAEQGAFSAITAILFEAQDSLGLIPWREIAARAKTRDPGGVAACVADVSDSTRFSRIDAGIRLSEEIGARGTPTVAIDGVLLGRTPSRQQLLELIRSPRR